MKSHEIQEIYPCQICDLEYPTMAALMSHQNAHKPKTTYPRDRKSESCCQDCGDIFFTEKDRENHTCPSLGGKRTFQCQHCSAICVGPTALALHCEHAHSSPGSDQNKCPLCFKCFLSLDELTAHMKIHDLPNTDPGRDLLLAAPDFQNVDIGSNILSSTNGRGISEYLICPYCFRDDFETIESLELHMQGVHSVKPTEVYTCNYCNAPYKNLYSLHEHMRAIHQNQPSMGIKYPCSRCGKEFPSIESLQDHKKRIHYRQKVSDTTHTCSHCNLAFVSAAALYEHVSATHPDLGKRLEDKTRLRSPKSTTQSKSQRPQTSTLKAHTSPASFSEAHTIINVPEPSHLLRHLKSPVKSETNPVIFPSQTPPFADSSLHTSPNDTPPVGNTDTRQDTITCEYCKATFNDATVYQNHVMIHIDSVLGKFICRQCQQVRFLSHYPKIGRLHVSF